MSDRESIDGRPVTEQQIADWAAQAEQGYDVDALGARERGRLGPSGARSRSIPHEQQLSLDRHGVS
jgi:hypothetical protein